MKTILSICTLLLTISSLWAQDPAQDFEQEMLNQLNSLNIVNFNTGQSQTNTAQVVQQGNTNVSDIQQVHPGNGSPNVALLIQNGNVNNAQMNMNGAGNTAEAMQLGNHNNYTLQLQGNDIETQVLQDGNNNSLEQDLSVSGLQYLVIQDGNNNSIQQTEDDPNTATGLIIRQQGSGMDLIIRNSNIYR